MFILDLVKALGGRRVPYALVGGYAVNLHGVVRGTLDIDLAVRFNEKDFAAVEKALTSLGLRSRLPLTAKEVFRFREEYVLNRDLTAWTFVNPHNPAQIVDVILTHDLDSMHVVRKKLDDATVRVVAVDDLIAMKRASDRPQDRVDVEALEKLR